MCVRVCEAVFMSEGNFKELANIMLVSRHLKMPCLVFCSILRSKKQNTKETKKLFHTGVSNIRPAGQNWPARGSILGHRMTSEVNVKPVCVVCMQ